MATVLYDNPPAREDLRLDTFRSIMAPHGPAKSCKFMVTFTPKDPNFNKYTGFPINAATLNLELPYLCEAAELPGRGFQSVDVRYYGPNQKLPFQTTYEDINLTFICRAKSLERQFFDDWMNIIHPPNDYNLFYRDQYACTVNIYHFSDGFLTDGGPRGSHAQYHFQLQDAYPILVNPQPITWADSEFLRLTVTFTYVRWSRPKLDPVTDPLRSNDLISGAAGASGSFRTTNGTRIS